MQALDEYLARCKCGKPCVVHVFDQKDASDDNAVNHVAALQREAQAILDSIFARDGGGGGGGGAQGNGGGDSHGMHLRPLFPLSYSLTN